MLLENVTSNFLEHKAEVKRRLTAGRSVPHLALRVEVHAQHLHRLAFYATTFSIC